MSTPAVPAASVKPGGPTSSSDETWTIARVLDWTKQRFAERGIDNPRLDAEILLAHALGKNRVYLYTHYDQPLNQNERDAFRSLVKRRSTYEPVAYLTGEREFYGRAFSVTPAVLIPRPETEHLIEAVRGYLETHPGATRLADIGTGSGAIAITMAASSESLTVVASDISSAALEVAANNAARHKVEGRISFLCGDGFVPFEGQEAFDIITANLPYIGESERAGLMPDVKNFEPALALFSGADGLDLLKRVIAQAPSYLRSKGLLALEIGSTQWPAVEQLLLDTAAFKNIRVVKDLSGHNRIALAERT